MLDFVFSGIGAADLAVTLNRVAVGTFFAFSGFHKLFNHARHETFVATLKECRVPCVRFNSWWVPSVEFAAGSAVAIGLLSPLAALGLLVVTLVAILTDGWKRAMAYKPIDAADCVDDFLYLPEVLYMVMLLAVVLTGPGPYSLDAVITSKVVTAAVAPALGVMVFLGVLFGLALLRPARTA